MGYTTIIDRAVLRAIGQDATTPRRPSAAGNINDNSGSEVNSGSLLIPTGETSQNVFRPGKIAVDDTRGVEVNKNAVSGLSNNYFRPGQVKVDDERGTEVNKNAVSGSSNNYFRPGQIKVDDKRGTEVVVSPALQPVSSTGVNHAPNLNGVQFTNHVPGTFGFGGAPPGSFGGPPFGPFYPGFAGNPHGFHGSSYGGSFTGGSVYR